MTQFYCTNVCDTFWMLKMFCIEFSQFCAHFFSFSYSLKKLYLKQNITFKHS